MIIIFILSLQIKINSFNLILNAIKNKKTVLTPEDVYYYINEYGTRGEWSIKNCKPEYINIAVLGCSFTFGVGISEPKIWPAQIKQNLPFIRCSYCSELQAENRYRMDRLGRDG